MSDPDDRGRVVSDEQRARALLEQLKSVHALDIGRDMVIAAHQDLTRQWWDERSGDFELVVSELVQEEAARGDAEAATLIEVLDGVLR